MRPVGAFSKTLGVALAVAAFITTATVQAAPQQNQAIVRSIRGSANVTTDAGANWRALNVGAKLNQQSIIRTAPGSTVDLYLGVNGPVVRVTESTTLGIDKLTMDAAGAETVVETQLDLRNGRILGNVKKLAAASKYEVKTPQGVAGIRGTRYDISADGTVTVLDGTVIVVYVVNGVAQPAVTVNGGQTVTPRQPIQVVAATPEQLRYARDNMPDTGAPVIIGDGGIPTTVIVVEPKEALQDGDRAKLETQFGGSPSGF